MKTLFKLSIIVFLFSFTDDLLAQKKSMQPKQKYDIAAFVWPLYHPDERAFFSDINSIKVFLYICISKYYFIFYSLKVEVPNN
jgi:hypothetical protein